MDNIVENIRITAKDIDQKSANLKNINEQIQALIVDMPEYKEVEELEESLAEARKKLKIALENRRGYTDLTESAGRLKEELKDDKEILSSHVVEYYASTKEHMVEMDESNGDAREVVVIGKLGKSGKLQTNIFTHGNVS